MPAVSCVFRTGSRAVDPAGGSDSGCEAHGAGVYGEEEEDAHQREGGSFGGSRPSSEPVKRTDLKNGNESFVRPGVERAGDEYSRAGTGEHRRGGGRANEECAREFSVVRAGEAHDRNVSHSGAP